jgi:hypothetical protein
MSVLPAQSVFFFRDLAQSALFTWRPRAMPRASEGTSSVIDEPAAT